MVNIEGLVPETARLLPPMPEEAPAFAPRLLLSTNCLWNESKILARLLYKVKNQHRNTFYYRRLQQALRILKNMAKIELHLQAYFEEDRRTGSTHSSPDGGSSLVPAQLDNMAMLCQRLSTTCRSAYLFMEREYSETYFVPLMVTGMALVARLSTLAKMVWEEDIPRARHKFGIVI